MNAEELSVGTVTGCFCPRHLLAGALLTGRIGIWGGRVNIPDPAPHVALRVYHASGCPASRGMRTGGSRRVILGSIAREEAII